MIESVTVEITQIAAMIIRIRWMISEMVRPSPPKRCQKVRFARWAESSSAFGSTGKELTGAGVGSWSGAGLGGSADIPWGLVI
ncbi:hypothetical protein LBMAG55_04230 [Verrucomicrobiota bacterium]|nr:hypothetical protein LBMAG55_04230 [Verrucomicrobiota bacterium]